MTKRGNKLFIPLTVRCKSSPKDPIDKSLLHKRKNVTGPNDYIINPINVDTSIYSNPKLKGKNVVE